MQCDCASMNCAKICVSHGLHLKLEITFGNIEKTYTFLNTPKRIKIYTWFKKKKHLSLTL